MFISFISLPIRYVKIDFSLMQKYLFIITWITMINFDVFEMSYILLNISNYYDILKKGIMNKNEESRYDSFNNNYNNYYLINNNYNYSKGLRTNKILNAVKIEKEMRGENKFHD